MRTRITIGLVALATLLGGSLAEAFRYVELGEPVPAMTVADAAGATVRVPPAGRVSVIVFWRAGQALSQDALADLQAVAGEPVAAGVEFVAVTESGAIPERAQDAYAPLRMLLDREGRVAEAYGSIVAPSTAIVRADGRLAYYLPSRPANYRGLVAAHLAHARGEISAAELATRVGRMGETTGISATAEVEFKRGVGLADDGRWDEAAGAFTRALKVEPGHAGASLRLGYALLELGRHREALARFNAALAGPAASPAARVGRAVALLRLGRRAEGIRLLEEAIALNPEPVRGHWELARAYEASGELERAIEHYRWAYRKLVQGRK